MRSLPAVIGCLALGLSLTACGGNGGDSGGSGGEAAAKAYAKTPVDQIKKDVISAMTSADGVHMTGRIVQSGQSTGFDLHIAKSGDCTGAMTVGDQGSMTLLRVDGTSYFKADRKFWEAHANGAPVDAVLQMIGDKWVTDSSDPEGFGDLCDLSKMLKDDGTKKQDTVAGTGTVDGTAVIKLSSTDAGKRTEVDIAATSPHYLLHMEKAGGQHIDFSDLGTSPDIPAKPSSDDVFDTAQH